MEGYVHSIESFGTVDGPGVRLVVFLQGCPLRCQFCHNPDTWQPKIGNKMTDDVIIEKYERNRPFLKSGGITVTGGEPLLQIDFVTSLFKKAKQNNIHTCLDSSGITFTNNNKEKFDELMKYTDIILLDIKQVDDEKHRLLTGLSNRNVLNFARYLSDINKPVWIRHVLINGLTNNEKDLTLLGELIADLRNVKAIDILPFHQFGKSKYENLNIEYPLKDKEETTKEEATKARAIVLNAFKNKINREKDNVKNISN